MIMSDKNVQDIDNIENHSLAYEMLKELKASARRWFILSLVELFIILALIWYISLPVEEVTTQYEQSIEDVQDSDNMSQSIIEGGEDNGKNEAGSQ